MRERWERRDWIFAVLLTVFGLAVWWPTRALPYHWDAATFIVRAARDLVDSGFSPFIAEHSEFAHPPLFVAALGLSWEVFGTSLIVSHLFILPFVVLAIVSTYGLGRWVHSRAVGLAAACLLATTPVFVSEIGEVYVDLPICGLTAAALCVWFRGRPAASAALFCAAAAIKIPSLVFPCALISAGLFVASERRKLLWLIAPFSTVIVWLAYHRWVTGWLLSRPRLKHYAPHDITSLPKKGWQVSVLMLEQWRWLLVLSAVVAGLSWLVANRQRLSRPFFSVETWTLIMCVLGGVAFFTIAGEFGQRYGIMLMPSIYILAAMSLHAALGRVRFAFLGAVTLLCVLFVTAWFPSTAPTKAYSTRPDANLGYMDLIGVGVDTAAYLQEKHPDARVFGTFPESYWLGEPLQGYTTQRFEVQDCRRYRPDPSRDTIIIAHLYSPQQVECWKLVNAVHAQLLKRFQHNGKWVGLFIPGPAARSTP